MFSYQKLKSEVVLDEDDHHVREIRERSMDIVRSRSWCKFKRVPVRRRRWKRFRLKVPNLSKFLRRGRRIRLVSSIRVSYSKVLKRFKDGQGHFNDLFAGNYLFMQVNPTPLKYYPEKYNCNHNHGSTVLKVKGYPSTNYPLPRIA